jgi:hypothetical protein
VSKLHVHPEHATLLHHVFSPGQPTGTLAAAHLLRQGPSGTPERAPISWSNMALLVAAMEWPPSRAAPPPDEDREWGSDSDCCCSNGDTIGGVRLMPTVGPEGDSCTLTLLKGPCCSRMRRRRRRSSSAAAATATATPNVPPTIAHTQPGVPPPPLLASAFVSLPSALLPPSPVTLVELLLLANVHVTVVFTPTQVTVPTEVEGTGRGTQKLSRPGGTARLAPSPARHGCPPRSKPASGPAAGRATHLPLLCLR